MRKSLILSTLILLSLSFTAAAWDAPDGSPVISLPGRTAEPQSLETITLANPENGRVVVEIWVDEAGNVMRAAPISDGSGTASFAMRDRCRQAAKKLRFNRSATPCQKGTVVYAFSNAETMSSCSGKRPVTFLGVPVDGPIAKMIVALGNKGFRVTTNDHTLKGWFNGCEVSVLLHTNRGKVDRVMVAFPASTDGYALSNRYNTLLGQMASSPKYTAVRGTVAMQCKHSYAPEELNGYCAVFRPKDNDVCGTVWMRPADNTVYLYYDNISNRPDGSDL